MAPDPRATEILLALNEAIEQGHTCAAMIVIVPGPGGRPQQHVYTHCRSTIHELLMLLEGAIGAKDTVLSSALPAVEKAAAQSADPRLHKTYRFLKTMYG